MTNSKITDQTARAILLAEGTAAQIAKEHGVSHQTVRLYKNLKTAAARDAATALEADGLEVVPLGGQDRHEFTDEQIVTIRLSNKSSKKMAEEMGCSASLIRMIRTRKAYV